MEIYRYRVVYPGGTYVRINPNLTAEKTERILEFGTIFEANKSLVLDGINYVKLADGSGWVFGSKGGNEILELVEVVRINPKESSETNPQQSSFSKITFSQPQKEKQIRESRNEFKFWKDVRNRSSSFTSYFEFSLYVSQLNEQSDIINFKTPKSHIDQKIRQYITYISATTRQYSSIFQTRDLEDQLWILSHLGKSKFSQLLQLIVQDANDKFESFSEELQSDVLFISLEVAGRTRIHCKDLAPLIEVLPDDLKNFIQRWIIINSEDRYPKKISPSHSPRQTSPRGDEEDIEDNSSISQSSSDSISPSVSTISSTSSSISSSSSANSSSWLSSLLCAGFRNSQKFEEKNTKESSVSPMSIEVVDRLSSKGIWRDITSQIKAFTHDPNLQYAGII